MATDDRKPKGPLCSENGILGFTNEEIALREELDARLKAERQKWDSPSLAELLEAVALDLLRQLRERDKTEYAWLLERRKDGRTEWLGLDATGDWFWSTDSLKALRFARKQDGEAMCAIIEDAEMVTEHGWGP